MNYLMRNCILLICFLSVFISCSQDNKQKIIPRKDLVNLMVDMHIADAIALNYNINEQFGGLDSALLYNTVLNSYGYTKEQFVYTLNYYTKEPEKLTKIYDEVFTILSRRSEETKALYSSYSVALTRNIWKPKQSRFIARGDTAHYPSMFDFAVDTIGDFVIISEIKITTKDSSIRPRIVAYFYNPKDDIPKNRVYFDETELHKSAYKREYSISKECTDPELSRIRLIIPMHDTGDSLFYKDFEMYNLRVSLVLPKKPEKIRKKE
jgi:hypothetical protein